MHILAPAVLASIGDKDVANGERMVLEQHVAPMLSMLGMLAKSTPAKSRLLVHPAVQRVVMIAHPKPEQALRRQPLNLKWLALHKVIASFQ